jgi:hypothetical protein
MKKTSLMLAMVLGLFVLVEISYAMSPADEALINKIDGRRYAYIAPTGSMILDVRGNIFIWAVYFDKRYQETDRFEIRGRETKRQGRPASFQKVWADYSTFIISDDGETITVRAHFTDGDIREYMYFWQR